MDALRANFPSHAAIQRYIARKEPALQKANARKARRKVPDRLTVTHTSNVSYEPVNPDPSYVRVIKKRSRDQPATSTALPVPTTRPALWDSDDEPPTPKRHRVIDDEDADSPAEDPITPKVLPDSSEPTYLPPRPPHDDDDHDDDAPMPPRAASTRPSSTTSSHNQSRASSSATEGKKTGKSSSTSSQRQRFFRALRLYHRSRLKHTRFSLHLRRDQGLLQPLPPTPPTKCILFMTSSKEPTIPTRTITLNDETVQDTRQQELATYLTLVHSAPRDTSRGARDRRGRPLQGARGPKRPLIPATAASVLRHAPKASRPSLSSRNSDNGVSQD
jgi:hypothetical protein